MISGTVEKRARVRANVGKRYTQCGGISRKKYWLRPSLCMKVPEVLKTLDAFAQRSISPGWVGLMVRGAGSALCDAMIRPKISVYKTIPKCIIM
jgi:hypothetical protein